MDMVTVIAIVEVNFILAWSSKPSALNAWQFLYDDSDGRTRRTADPKRPSVYCGLLAPVSRLGAATTLSSAFSVFFPVEVIDKRIVQGSSRGHLNTRSMPAHARVSLKGFEYLWGGVAQGNIW